MANLIKLNAVMEKYGNTSNETRLMFDAVKSNDEEYINAMYNFLICIKEVR